MIQKGSQRMSFRNDSTPANQLMAIQETVLEGEKELESPEFTSIELPDPSMTTYHRLGTVTSAGIGYSESSQSSQAQQKNV